MQFQKDLTIGDVPASPNFFDFFLIETGKRKRIALWKRI